MTSEVVKKGKVKTRRGVRTRLPDDFTPCKHTVLCGRGKENTMSSGNVHLKTLILKYLQSYSEAKKKIAKSLIVSEVLSEIKSNCNGDAAFVKFEGGRWWGVDDAFSREKIGCMFRDELHLQYRSSTKAKFARRKADQAHFTPAEESEESRELQSSSSSSSSSVPTLGESIGSNSSVSSDSSDATNQSRSLANEVFRVEPIQAPLLTSRSDYHSLVSNHRLLGEPQASVMSFPFLGLPEYASLNNFQSSGDNILDGFPDDISGIFDDE